MALITVSASKPRGLSLLRILWIPLPLQAATFQQKSQSQESSSHISGWLLFQNKPRGDAPIVLGMAGFASSTRPSSFSTNIVLFMGLKEFPAPQNCLCLAQPCPYNPSLKGDAGSTIKCPSHANKFHFSHIPSALHQIK